MEGIGEVENTSEATAPIEAETSVPKTPGEVLAAGAEELEQQLAEITAVLQQEAATRESAQDAKRRAREARDQLTDLEVARRLGRPTDPALDRDELIAEVAKLRLDADVLEEAADRLAEQIASGHATADLLETKMRALITSYCSAVAEEAREEIDRAVRKHLRRPLARAAALRTLPAALSSDALVPMAEHLDLLHDRDAELENDADKGVLAEVEPARFLLTQVSEVNRQARRAWEQQRAEEAKARGVVVG